MDDEDRWGSVILDHEPFRPVRKTVYGEGIFLDAWKAHLNEMEPHEIFVQIFWAIEGPLQPRDGKVIASFVAWLGTNCGRCFLDRGKFLKKDHGAIGFVFAWAECNVSRLGGRGRLNSLKAALLGADEITRRDIELADAFCEWLGSNEGELFVAKAEKEIAITGKAIAEQRSMEYRAMMRAKQVMTAEAAGR